MRQIRARIRDKRGADYTEAEVRELASVKLDRFLDPRAVRSDLLGHFKRQHQPAPLFLAGEEFPPEYTFDPDLTLGSARDLPRRILRGIRKLLSPLLKLFVNIGAITHPLHLQPAINTKHRELFARVSQRLQTRDELDALNFEMFNNLVVETTRLGIEVKNLRMLVESLSTRLDFDERRARALEGVVQYRPGTPLAPPPAPAPAAAPAGADDAENAAPGAPAARPARIRATAAVRGGADAGAVAGAAASKAASRARPACRRPPVSRPETTGSATTATTADRSPATAPATTMGRTTRPTSRPRRSPRCPRRRIAGAARSARDRRIDPAASRDEPTPRPAGDDSGEP